MKNRSNDDSTVANTASSSANPANEGEGSRSADRLYRAHVERFIESGQVAEAAEAAKKSVEAEQTANPAYKESTMNTQDVRVRLEAKHQELTARWNELKADTRQESEKIHHAIRSKLSDIES